MSISTRAHGMQEMSPQSALVEVHASMEAAGCSAAEDSRRAAFSCLPTKRNMLYIYIYIYMHQSIIYIIYNI